MANSVVLEMLVTQITFAINKFLTRVKFHGSSKGMFNPDKKDQSRLSRLRAKLRFKRLLIFLHCVPISTVSFQMHASRSKIIWFSKFFHWVVTNALTLSLKPKKSYFIKNLHVTLDFPYSMNLAEFGKWSLIMVQLLKLLGNFFLNVA